MIFVGEDGAPPSHRDVVVHPYGEDPHRIDTTSEHVDPMTYPLMFPDGVPRGWHPNIAHGTPGNTASTVGTSA